MSSVRLDVLSDVWLARKLSGTVDLGAGADHHLGVGLLSQGTHLARFAIKLEMPSWTGITKVTSCPLRLKVRQDHSNLGGSARFYFRRITEGWSQGTWGGQGGGDPGSETWSAGNATVYPGPSATTSGQLDTGGLGAPNEGDVITIDIIDFIEMWAPPSVMKRDGVTPCEGLTNYGLLAVSFDTGSSSRYIEFYSQSGATAPYATLNYTTNAAPSAPVLDTVGGDTYTLNVVTSDTTPDLVFHGVDSDDTVVSAYDLSLWDETASASVLALTNQTSGIAGMTVTKALGTLTAGHQYLITARTKDPAGNWSSYRSGWFWIAAVPTCSVTNPGSGGILAQLGYESGWTTPRFVVGHSYSDPGGLPQASYRYTIWASDNVGTVGAQVYTTGEVAGSGTGPFTLAHNLTNGNYYLIGVEVKNSAGAWSALSTRRNVRARWASGAYYVDTTKTPVGSGSGSQTLTGWSVASDITPNGGSIVIEYGSNTSTSAPAAYYGILGAVPLARYLHYRVWIMAWGSASPTSPTLNSHSVTYVEGAANPDGWNLATGSTIEFSEHHIGTRSLKVTGDATTQLLTLAPKTWYTLQGVVKRIAGMHTALAIYDAAWTAQLAWVEPTVDDAWEKIAETFYNDSFTSCLLLCWTAGTAGKAAYFDALKLEEGRVATPWTPAFVGSGVSVDAGGLQVAAQDGSVFRLIGSNAGAQDYVELGAMGLHAEIWGLRGVAAPSTNPPSGQVGLWYDSDDSHLKIRASGGTDFDLSDRVAASLLTTQGDLPYATGSAAWARLAKGTAHQWLRMNAGATAPEWSSVSCAVCTYSGTFSTSNNTETAISLNTEETDTDGYHSTTTSGTPRIDSRFTVPWTGWYFVIADVTWAGNATGRRYVTIYKSDGTRVGEQRTYPADTAAARVTASALIYLSASDYVYISTLQSSGGNLNVTSARCSIEFRGP